MLVGVCEPSATKRSTGPVAFGSGASGMVMNKFRFVVKDGRHYIYAPDGTPVLRYCFTRLGRVGNLREFCMWLVRPDGTESTRELIACHGGQARMVLCYLNTGVMYEGDRNWAGLDEHDLDTLRLLRQQYEL